MSSATTQPARNPQGTLRVGVLLVPPVQLLDVSPVDLFGMLSRSYLDECGLPSPLTHLGLDVEVHYINGGGEQSAPGKPEHERSSTQQQQQQQPTTAATATSQAACTASATLLTPHTLSSPAVAPGCLDILLIPGPPPAAVPSEAACAFLRGHAACESTDVMTICTGVFVALHAGILAGKTVTAPRGLIPTAQKMAKRVPGAEGVKWDSEVRWRRDGRIWCSGGITNGQDTAAAYIKEKWPGPLSNVVCALADVGDRPQRYERSMVVDGGWFGLQILRAAWRGLWSK